jgi:hypothetical protein
MRPLLRPEVFLALIGIMRLKAHGAVETRRRTGHIHHQAPSLKPLKSIPDMVSGK